METNREASGRFRHRRRIRKIEKNCCTTRCWEKKDKNVKTIESSRKINPNVERLKCWTEKKDRYWWWRWIGNWISSILLSSLPSCSLLSVVPGKTLRFFSVIEHIQVYAVGVMRDRCFFQQSRQENLENQFEEEQRNILFWNISISFFLSKSWILGKLNGFLILKMKSFSKLFLRIFRLFIWIFRSDRSE